MMLCQYIITCLAILLVTFGSIGNFETIVLFKNISSTNPALLDCSGSGSTNLEWQYSNPKNELSTLSATGPLLQLDSLNSVGEYFCKINGNYVKNFTVAYLSTPLIQNGTSLILIEGTTNQKIICVCIGCYPSVTLQWFHEQQVKSDIYELLPSPKYPDFNVSYNEDLETLNTTATLTFEMVHYMKHADYKCEATNLAGNKSAEIQLRVRSKYAALWPSLGIIAEIIILVFIMCGYEMRKNKVSAKNVQKKSKKPTKKQIEEMKSLHGQNPNERFSEI